MSCSTPPTWPRSSCSSERADDGLSPRVRPCELIQPRNPDRLDGDCGAVWAAAALGHYNTDKLAGIVTPEISDQTEVWMDWVVNEDGVAANQTMVPFVPDPGLTGNAPS